MENMEESL
jgi:hypothetical protein